MRFISAYFKNFLQLQKALTSFDNTGLNSQLTLKKHGQLIGEIESLKFVSLLYQIWCIASERVWNVGHRNATGLKKRV